MNWSELRSQMPEDRLSEILESWKYSGVLRHLHGLSSEAIARVIVRAVLIPKAGLYQNMVEVQTGGRSREFTRD